MPASPISALLAAASLATVIISGFGHITVAQQICAAGSGSGVAQYLKGNWYCSEVQAITYSNFPGHGYYSKITNMDAQTGQCEAVRYAYSGSLSPLNEELSLHVRGPTSLAQMAFYVPSAAANVVVSEKEKRVPDVRDRGREYGHGYHAKRGSVGHKWLHNRAREKRGRKKTDLIVERAVGDIVTATIDGKGVSWVNQYAGPGNMGATSPPEMSTPTVGVMQPVPFEKAVNKGPSVTTTLPIPSPLHNKTQTGSVAGNWVRQGYYQAAEGIAEGITFLNHFGGVNGVPGTTAGGSAFGASLSYASSDGKSGSAKPQVLSNGLLQDDTEIVIMSARSCNDGGCGYTRPGGVAYHGFSGSRKVFLLEFSMPLTGNTTFNGDMPAIWLNNAQIPLTSQYGTNPDCSCWTSGCGEFDIFEVLDSGDTKCKSTLHMAPAGGSSDWFQRPINDSVIVAVVFAGEDEKAVIRVLEKGTQFGSVISGGTVNEWVTGPSSVFELGE